jgi:hypothetical protein
MADGSIGVLAIPNRDHQRLQDADRALSDALASLTRAICLLGSREGKEAVQLTHGLVQNTQRYVQMHNEIGAAD